MEDYHIQAIAHIHTDFKEKFGIPRQSGRVPELEGTIVFEPKYRNPESLRGIEEFSHLWLIFDFSKSHRKEWSPTVRPPRLGGNRRVGVFASRSPFRPNPIGLSCVRLIRLEQTNQNGTILVVSGCDLLDNTPILDIKPYIPYADCHPDATGSYAEEQKSHKLTVEIPDDLLSIVPVNKRDAMIACLADDPRPSYQNDPERTYHMYFGNQDIHFRVKGNQLLVIGIEE